jgi:hypothetical protein
MTASDWGDERQIGVLEWDHYHAYFLAKFGPPGSQYRVVRHETAGYVEVSFAPGIHDEVAWVALALDRP